MHKLVFYDIESDKLRTKISQDLEQFGLIRYKSVFGSWECVFWKSLRKEPAYDCRTCKIRIAYVL
ncbi:MAG: CRISPR-associated endonuclease Cas2 [Bacteroidota bacterium]|nr:MAG: CRISPR-associated endonuclease Cas2 [Bacteroidota bacterium]